MLPSPDVPLLAVHMPSLPCPVQMNPHPQEAASAPNTINPSSPTSLEEEALVSFPTHPLSSKKFTTPTWILLLLVGEKGRLGQGLAWQWGWVGPVRQAAPGLQGVQGCSCRHKGNWAWLVRLVCATRKPSTSLSRSPSLPKLFLRSPLVLTSAGRWGN